MNLTRSRFGKEADDLVIFYTSSLPFDRRLYAEDIQGSMAHAKMLAKSNIITDAEYQTLLMGLETIREEIENNTFVFKNESEDIHMAIESRLFEIIGNVAGKLHTARSRNDQIALDMRLYTKKYLNELMYLLSEVQKALVQKAEENKTLIMPGYTHLQSAQPVLFAHHMLAYFNMFKRDYERFADALKRTDVMPLGSGALAGTTYNTDREFLTKELGFEKVSKNSMDSVSDRDFILETLSAAAICMMHFSRLSEEIILWSSLEFSFITLDDAYATGSSIMPQKKNPDVAELAKGKTGRVYGALMQMLTVMKGLPLTYGRDMQEDKECYFDALDTLTITMRVYSGMISTMKLKSDRIAAAIGQGYILATDMADALVRKGLSFREAHKAVGLLTVYAAENNLTFTQVPMEKYLEISPLFDENIKNITVEQAVENRNQTGGTSFAQVEKQISAAKKALGI
ncbi:MAG: argininosuccinate lyase [Chloroflexi bacterium]|nr:argininosuccinate lyase [Chloroflexota bacterium]